MLLLNVVKKFQGLAASKLLSKRGWQVGVQLDIWRP